VPDPARVDGVLVDTVTATVIAAALRELALVLRREGRTPSPGLLRLAADLHGCAGGSAAPSGGRAPVWAADDGISATTAEAAHLLGVSPERVRQLLRSGHLVGWFRAGRWFVDAAALHDRAREGGRDLTA
jgi:hypothetical protein